MNFPNDSKIAKLIDTPSFFYGGRLGVPETLPRRGSGV